MAPFRTVLRPRIPVFLPFIRGDGDEMAPRPESIDTGGGVETLVGRGVSVSSGAVVSAGSWLKAKKVEAGAVSCAA